jgi:hypothetical protein
MSVISWRMENAEEIRNGRTRYTMDLVSRERVIQELDVRINQSEQSMKKYPNFANEAIV